MSAVSLSPTSRNLIQLFLEVNYFCIMGLVHLTVKTKHKSWSSEKLTQHSRLGSVLSRTPSFPESRNVCLLYCPSKTTIEEFLPNNQKRNKPSTVSGDWNEAVLALWLYFLLSSFSSKGLGLGWKQFTWNKAMCYHGDKATLFTLLPNIHAPKRRLPPPPRHRRRAPFFSSDSFGVPAGEERGQGWLHLSVWRASVPSATGAERGGRKARAEWDGNWCFWVVIWDAERGRGMRPGLRGGDGGG